MSKRLTEWSAKPLFAGSSPASVSNVIRLKGKERSEDVQLRLYEMRDSENSPRSLRKTREALLQLTCTQEDDQGNMVALP